MNQKPNNKVTKFQKKRQLNIGIILFSLIFLYLVVTIASYLTKKDVTVYEVRKGSIVKDMSYTGLVLRSEKLVTSKHAGYVNYYLQNNSKVAKGTKLYTLSDAKLETSLDTTEETLALTSDEQYSIYMELQNFTNRFRNMDYEAVKQTKDNIQSLIADITNQSRIEIMKQKIQSGEISNAKLYGASDDGIVVYSMDGMEELTKDNVAPENLDRSSYEKNEFTDNRKVEVGDPLYKLITDENWAVFTEISKATYLEIKENTTIQVRLVKDAEKMRASLSLKKDGDRYFAYLNFTNAMIRYVNDRYLDIELILEDETGLKIPKSAVTSKDFYVVPDAYISHGGNSSSDGVLRRTTDKNGKTITEFVVVNIYYEDTENGIVYLDSNAFTNGDVLLKENSNETYTLNERAPLQGVYNINKGYAVFKQIHILCESDSYYIVEDGNNYGLSNYDHIALDSSMVQENDIMF